MKSSPTSEPVEMSLFLHRACLEILVRSFDLRELCLHGDVILSPAGIYSGSSRLGLRALHRFDRFTHDTHDTLFLNTIPNHLKMPQNNPSHGTKVSYPGIRFAVHTSHISYCRSISARTRPSLMRAPAT